MYKNIGVRIKGLASFFCGMGILISVLCGIVMMNSGNSMLEILGLILLIGGSLSSWIGSLAAYGFGQLIDNSDKLVQMGEKILEMQQDPDLTSDEKLDILRKWRADGLITEEEFNERMESLK